ncbi:superinfection immunity protein [Actinomadura adrarensis]|uniref:Superinfection immunity protein n=1 Tax=Actinomadura adrarensis TaxID=1819600 RepID=A0ABW3CLK7_9ACTN
MKTIMRHPFFWLFLVAVLVGMAVLPTLIAMARGADEIMPILLVNVLGCAMILGWPVALVMALRWPRRSEVMRPLVHLGVQAHACPAVHRSLAA